MLRQEQIIRTHKPSSYYFLQRISSRLDFIYKIINVFTTNIASKFPYFDVKTRIFRAVAKNKKNAKLLLFSGFFVVQYDKTCRERSECNSKAGEFIRYSEALAVQMQVANKVCRQCNLQCRKSVTAV